MADERAALLALVEASGDMPWHELASLVEAVGSASAVLDGETAGLEPGDADAVRGLAARVDADAVGRQRTLIHAMQREGARLVTVLDDDYPANLREIFNRPPFLFIRGSWTPADEQSVSVVGTRRATREGLELAHQFAAGLAERGITVLSGLAEGIDAAAHEAALEAGGRTIAVYGTGIRRVYPPHHEGLAARIEKRGALISQFWPDAPPTKWSFPLRNVVTSGLGMGTVVIQADGRSGARNQARHCLEHGKRLFLVDSVTHEDWASKYAERPGALVVHDVGDVLTVLDELSAEPEQLTLPM